MMLLKKELTNKTNNTPYLRDILILLSIALVLGIYLILTTVVISRDSVTYVGRAQWLQDNLARELAYRPSGYELLILLSYRIFYAITGISSVQGWIWAAQGLTLLCKALAVIALYLTGCLITHRKSSFWGCVILLLLPEPAQWGSDVLREWPYLLFLISSVLSLIYGVRKSKAWPLALTGLFAGMGFLICLQSIHLVALGLLILTLLMLKPPKDYLRTKALTAAILLITGFAVPNLVYSLYSGQIINNYLKEYMSKVLPVVSDSATDETHTLPSEESDTTIDPESETLTGPDKTDTGTSETEVEGKGGTLPGFAYELYKDTGELLVWFYLPFWIIGLYLRLRNKADPLVRYIIGGLILMGTGMILMRYFYKEATVTQRWVFPLVALTAFYIYTGIEQVALWAERKKAPNCKQPEKWTRILVAVGILICLFKCFEPLGAGKESYLEAADWISSNTQECDWFYTFDTRIPFYAKRNNLLYDEVNAFLNPFDMKYLIIPAQDKRSMTRLPEGMILEASFGQKREFFIYRSEEP
jgi:4-amino-4-deoxy-L-arabinose transferase-like glycosyltransferase